MTIGLSIGINTLAGNQFPVIQMESVLSDNYTLSIDTISVYPGDQAMININLHNLAPISGFEILFNYDVTALSLVSISNAGTRSNAFEYFTYRLEEGGIPGDVYVTGISDIDHSFTPGNLPSGDGSIFKALFYATNNQDFAGFSVPVEFAFRDLFNHYDNTLSDTAGVRIPQSSIIYNDGFVSILKATASGLGDINLNGIPYEIGDAIYLTNYFISPDLSPLDPVQRANSDVNQDGYAPSLADLVFLVLKMVGINGGNAKLAPSDGSAVSVDIEKNTGQFGLHYSSAVDIGGMLVTLHAPGKAPGDLIIHSQMQEAGMICDWRTDGDLIRVLIYSKTGHSMPAGDNRFFTIEKFAQFKIDSIELSTADGYILPAVLKDDDDSQVPGDFDLYQNYPNPFNPSTTISFNMPVSSEANLTVFDILGREIRTLAMGQLGAGYHEFIWDGKNNAGNSVSSGIYFYKLKTADYSAQKKMILLK